MRRGEIIAAKHSWRVICSICKLPILDKWWSPEYVVSDVLLARRCPDCRYKE